MNGPERRPTVAAVVVAGGRGRRFGGPVMKQCLELKGRPVWQWSVELFLRRVDVRQTVLVRPAGETFGDDVPKLTCVSGGATRAASVRNGVAAIDTDVDLIAVHDAARPLTTAATIDRLIASAATNGAAVPGRAISGTVRRCDDRGIAVATVDRTHLFEMQTPQAARHDWLRDALAAFGDGVTDEGEALMRAGRPVRVVATGPTNFKITTPADLELARLVWAARGAA